MTKLTNLDQETIKKINQNNILYILYREGELTKHEISKKLGISIPTVITNISELIESGLVEEAGVAKSTGGRKPMIVRFLDNGRYSIGVVITKGHIRMVLTDLKLRILEERNAAIDEDVKTMDDIIDIVKDFKNYVLSKLDISEDRLLGIGFSLPGTVNEKTLVLENAINLGIKDIDFNKYSFGCPSFIENEANAAGYAEYFFHHENTNTNLVFVSITEGIGTGIVFKNLLYKGSNKRAGEWGHMTIVKGGRKCACGKEGCWEMYASSKALLRSYNERVKGEEKHIKNIIEKANEDIEAKNILEEYLSFLAEGIKNIILILDPDKIVIGGEIGDYEKDIKKSLCEKIFQPNGFFTKKDCEIQFSSLKADAPVLGGALLPILPLFFTNNTIL